MGKISKSFGEVKGLQFPKLTLVMVMPSTREVLLDDIRGLVLGEQTIHLVLLAPQQRLRQHLSSLLHVEVASAQEAEQGRVAWYLKRCAKFSYR